MKKPILITLILAALPAATALQAQQPAGSPPDDDNGAPTVQSIMAGNDLNEDGIITREEAARADKVLIRVWGNFDLDRDGRIDAAEVARALAAQRAAGANGRSRMRPPPRDDPDDDAELEEVPVCCVRRPAPAESPVPAPALQQAGPIPATPITATTATNTFALDLYQRLSSDKGNAGRNLWFSPYSITSALAMTAEGARGSTLAQMAKTLRFGDVSPNVQLLPIHEGMAALNRQLATDESSPYQLVVANALWGDQKYPFDQKYVDTIHKYYATAGISPVDFAHDPEAARSRINARVEEQTRKKITDLLPPGSVDPVTRLVLTNAVYFKGSWLFPFSAGATRPQPFHLDAARTTSAPLMRLGARLQYTENDQLQAVSLPFISKARTGAQDISMIVILPRKVDGLAELENSLTGASLDALFGALSTRLVQAFLPKFRMTEAVSLGGELAAMGMPDAFNSTRADFSGISPLALTDRLYIGQVLHKAYLAVDENGAEAAAATAVEMLGGGRAPPPEEPAIFRADHPFLILLRHNPSGTILFMGRMMNPAQ